MAFTKTPTADTYSQEDILLSRELVSRQNDPLGTKDESLTNIIVEVVKNRALQDNRTYHVKRAGTSQYTTSPNSLAIRGSYYWKDKSLFAYCAGSDVFLLNTSTMSTFTCSSVFSTTTGKVGFTAYLYDDGVVKLVASDGTDLVTIADDGTVETSVSPNLPVPHIPQPIFLNGYLFLLKKDTADIVNSNLNSPLEFTEGDFLMSEIHPDWAIGMAKLNNYIVVFGASSIEYFWDAANESGSPLKRNDTPVKYSGLIGDVITSGNSVFFFGYDDNKQVDIFQLRDFSIESFASETIRRAISSLEGLTSSFSGHMVSCLGHDFFMANLGSKSFVFDLKEKVWTPWQWKTNSSFNMTNSETLVLPTGNKTIFTIGDSPVWYVFNDKVYRDDGVNFPVIPVTEPSDFGTLNRKTMSRLSLVCDRPPANSNISVSFSDDDYQSWYGNYTINLNQDLPSISGGFGQFRQRAIKLIYSDNYPLRIQKIQVDINKGRN